MSSITKKDQVKKVIENTTQECCMILLSQWKDCNTTFSELYHKQYFATLSRISKYANVEYQALESIVRRNLDDLKVDGSILLKGQELREHSVKLTECQGCSQVRIFTPRSVLRILVNVKKDNIGNEIFSILLDHAESDVKKMKNKIQKKKEPMLNVRLTEKEDKLIRKTANRKNCTKSDLIKEFINSLDDEDEDDNDDLIQEIYEN